MAVAYVFWKNLILVLPQIWFAFFSSATGIMITESFVMTMHNILFTALPPMFAGFFERDIPQKAMMDHPLAYYEFRKNKPLTGLSFLWWMFDAVYVGSVLFLVALFMELEAVGAGYTEDGMTSDIWLFGNIIHVSNVVLSNTLMLLYSREWNMVVVGGNLFGTLSFYAFCWFYGDVTWYLNLKDGEFHAYRWEFYHTFSNTFQTPRFWLYSLLVASLLIMPHFIRRAFAEEYFFSLGDIIYRYYSPRKLIWEEADEEEGDPVEKWESMTTFEYLCQCFACARGYNVFSKEERKRNGSDGYQIASRMRRATVRLDEEMAKKLAADSAAPAAGLTQKPSVPKMRSKIEQIHAPPSHDGDGTRDMLDTYFAEKTSCAKLIGTKR